MPSDRLKKLNEDNKLLAQSLKNDLDESSRAASKASIKKKRAAGSDLGSARDSEDRQSLPPTGRGQKRARETEIEKVSEFYVQNTCEGDSILWTDGSDRTKVVEGSQAHCEGRQCQQCGKSHKNIQKAA